MREWAGREGFVEVLVWECLLLLGQGDTKGLDLKRAAWGIVDMGGPL